MASDIPTKDSSPFPSASDMDMDMWRATRPVGANRPIRITSNSEAPRTVAMVYPLTKGDTGTRDMWARRLEMMGDLYEALRRAADKMALHGMDVSEENTVLGEFCAPKPFAEGE